MIINETCKACQLRRNVNLYPADAAAEKIKTYQSRVRDILDRCDGLTTPQVAEQMYDLRREIFGADKDYTEIKRYYNKLMLSLLPYMEQQVLLRRTRSKGLCSMQWPAIISTSAP